MKILFVDSTVRERSVSRTYLLCSYFLERHGALHPGDEIETLCLAGEDLRGLDRETLAEREGLINQGDLSAPMFRYARQFAAADMILVGAPYWDLSFPSILKTYVELVSVNGIAFRYEGSRSIGMCRAKKLLYVTTAGGIIGERDFGSQYMEGLCGFFGIGEFKSVRAEGLDIWGNDADEIIEGAKRELDDCRMEI